ncbi:MAG TPA: hypothetical protein VME18_11625 [Acidobacteriaceae bacterium]|nr:hypothetical protein [Acidobacteriaceae bacterium]
MEDSDIGLHSGIPLGHKFFAVLLAAAIASAGCAWLIHQSGRSASAAVLAFQPALAQSVDPGIASAKNPAVVLADARLDDPTVMTLAKQTHLAAATPAARMGEFRSGLQLTQPSALRLDVRFEGAAASQSMAIANAVAHALAAWNPASGGAATPPAQPPSATSAASATPQPAVAHPGEPSPAAAAASASQAAPPSHALPDHPLSEALSQLGAQLSAVNGRLDRLAAGGASSSSYVESAQQSLLRSEVGEAQTTVARLHTGYAKELADPNISARLNEVRQALDSILPGGHRSGFNAAGVSAWELSAERSELRQAIRTVNDETKRVQLAEAAHPAFAAPPNAPAALPSSGKTAANPSPAASSPSPAAAQSSGVKEQNIPAPGSQAPRQPTQNLFSIVRLAAPASRPPLWPAMVAGAFCGLLYFGIAALVYRRTQSSDLYPEMSSAPQRMITPADPIRIEESPAPPPELPRSETAPRQRAAFEFEPAPPEKTPALIGKPAASAEMSPAPVVEPTAPPESAAAPEQAENDAPADAAASCLDSLAEPVASARPAEQSVAAPAESAPAQAAAAGEEDGSPLGAPIESPAEHRFYSPSPQLVTGSDPVADRIRKSLSETSIGRTIEGRLRPGHENKAPDQAEGRDSLADKLSSPDKS